MYKFLCEVQILHIAEVFRGSLYGFRGLAEFITAVKEKGKDSFFKGGDNTSLNEVLSKFTSLQREMLKTQTSVATGSTFDILSRFNKVGGEFSTLDPRSSGNIGAIQFGLSNPASDNIKARSFDVLRRQNPEMSTFDLLREREKGLGSPGLLKGMLGQIDNIRGDDSQKQLNLGGVPRVIKIGSAPLV